ncbi:cuticle protein 18.6-like isoform X2 [Nylanderia fulva]|uniref:cuticle protein 18.6-like isoform X2 n=1 Tax=Nylanderia fulva TaxID=613905 RepID=UPI0010FB4B85|nr:cuticle protein 18.6-like isoform X2 [Nylanderia fulva]
MVEMTFKVNVALTIGLALVNRSITGVIPLDSGAHHDHHRVSVASSYMHFHGPVQGPEYEIKVPHVVVDEHHFGEHNYLHGLDHQQEHHHHDGTYTVDYVAHPKYEFSYGVEDHHTGDFHGQKESRDGGSVTGEYSVKDPGGTFRVVSYHADKEGFHAVVHTTGKNDHSGGVYGGQGHDTETQGLPLHEYAAALSAHAGY